MDKIRPSPVAAPSHLCDADVHDLIAQLIEVESHRRAGWLADRLPGERLLQARLLDAVGASESSLAPNLSQDTADPDLPAGSPREIGRYRIVRKLGSGGMGTVYLARDPVIERDVALKVLSEALNSEAERERFRREAVTAGGLGHSNIVTVFDAGDDQGRQFIAMEYVAGRTLSEIIEDRVPGRHLSLDRKLEILEAVCAAVAAAHQAGVIHRDIKPANIMVDDAGVVKVLDFGIAKAFHGVGRTGATLTQQHAVVGTRGYIAPELMAGGQADTRSDIFSMSVVAYELLTGESPFGTDDVDIGRRAMVGAVEPMSSVGTGAHELDRIIRKGLALDPAQRFENIAAMRQAFHAVRSAKSRRWRAWRLATLGAIGVLATGAVTTHYWTIAPSTPTPVSLLVADFENSTGDRAFDGALEQALGLAMEGATFVTGYPRLEAQQLARELKSGAQLDAQSARLIAVREGITYVLAGSVGYDGKRYVLRIDAVEPVTGNIKRTARSSARGKGDVLSAVGTAAARLRTELGDNTPESIQLAAMETFTSSSLDAMREYSSAQVLAKEGDDESAVSHYQDAIRLDSRFGRAFSGLAVSTQRLGRSEQSRAAWAKALSLIDRMSERERYRTLGAYYLGSASDYEKAVEQLSLLVHEYPGDSAGFGNLALAHFFLRDFSRAFENGRRGVAIDPRNVRQRNNLALYAMYSGQFDAAAREAKQVLAERPKLETAYLPIAMEALQRGNFGEADAAYLNMSRTGSVGASLASIGRADAALYQGRPDDAMIELEQRIAAEHEKNTAYVALERVALAEAYVQKRDFQRAAEEVRRALQGGSDLAIVVPAARVLLESGRLVDARKLASVVAQQPPNQHQAYGKIILAEAAMMESKVGEAIRLLTDAIRLRDLWLARMLRAQAYVRGALFAEALHDLDECERRRGEATAVFFDDVPTFRHMAPLPYWKGRIYDGLGSPEAAMRHYQQFLALHPAAPALDPLADDARTRLTRLLQK
jgi:tetratricopeptide (TPR) repeat protein/tRNA A-37 threonylcarbamoyl transferase component Bud32